MSLPPQWPMERDMNCFPCRKAVRHKAVEMDQYPFVRFACVPKGHRDLHALTRPDYEAVQVALTGVKSPSLGL